MRETVPIDKKYMLTIEEASQYFHIGSNRLRKFISEHPTEKFLFHSGTKALIKRKQFESILDELSTI